MLLALLMSNTGREMANTHSTELICHQQKKGPRQPQLEKKQSQALQLRDKSPFPHKRQMDLRLLQVQNSDKKPTQMPGNYPRGQYSGTDPVPGEGLSAFTCCHLL